MSAADPTHFPCSSGSTRRRSCQVAAAISRTAEGESSATTHHSQGWSAFTISLVRHWLGEVKAPVGSASVVSIGRHTVVAGAAAGAGAAVAEAGDGAKAVSRGSRTGRLGTAPLLSWGTQESKLEGLRDTP